MGTPPDNDVLWARALRHSYRGEPALLGVSINVRAGEILTVAGHRGSGKSTLLHCLSGRLVPEEGEVWFNSAPVHTLSEGAREALRRDRFGWIGPGDQLVPELSAWENAALPLLMRGDSHRESRAVAQEWLERLDIGSVARRRPADLPHSQRQRIAVARALVTGPDVVFADEPTAPLHRADRDLLLRTLTSAARSHGITVVLATTDPELGRYADRTITLADGRPDTATRPHDRELTAPARV
ncbi:ABC transporter ATP-binding protein [Streptomyces polygonati]|uniref:ABC transporter ATP-binding protein n=1 Tax=Streptomyces polygonati TaxID=1617087 RepID=A0ABV8HHJ9_9ACTN